MTFVPRASLHTGTITTQVPTVAISGRIPSLTEFVPGDLLRVVRRTAKPTNDGDWDVEVEFVAANPDDTISGSVR